MLIPILIGVALLCYGTLTLIGQDADRMYFDMRCEGELIGTKTLKSLNPDEMLPERSYKFRYTIADEKFEGWYSPAMTDYDLFIIGRFYRLRYHSKNPKEFQVETKQEPKIYSVGWMIGGTLIIIFTVMGIIWVK